MNPNETRTLWISIGAALFGVFLLYSYTQEKSASLTKQFGAKKRVVIAKQTINAMQTIDETMLQVIDKPQDFVEPSAINDPEIAVGKVALAPIKEGEQVLESKIITPGPVTGLSLQVAPGKRAVTIPVDEVRGVAKLIKPGDRIDLVAAIDMGSGLNKKRVIKTIMEDVVILATGLRVANELPRLYEKSGKNEYIRNISSDTGFTNVTIEVAPKEAQDLIYILSTAPGSLYMTLRHPTDRTKKARTLGLSNVDSLLDRVPTSALQQSARSKLPTPTKRNTKTKTRSRTKRNGGYIDL